MTWFKSHQEMGTLSKVFLAADALQPTAETTPPEVMVIGHFHYLAWWALTFAEDGNLSAERPVDVARNARWHGDPDKLIEALVDARLLARDAPYGDPDKEGGSSIGELVIHEWWENYAGALVKERNRKRQSRSEASADKRGQSTPKSKSVSKKKSREKNKTSSASPKTLAPEPGEAEFEDGWVHHRAASTPGTKRTEKGNCGWLQWTRLLQASGLTPAEALVRWKRRVDAHIDGFALPHVQRLLRPENCMLTDDAIGDHEAANAAKAGRPTTDEEERKRKRKRAETEAEHNRLEGWIRENGPRPDVVRRLNGMRVSLGWEPKEFGEWIPSGGPEITQAPKPVGKRRAKFTMPGGDVGDAVRKLSGKAEANG